MTVSRRMETLVRRRDFLLERDGGSSDRAEAAALNWAIRVLDNARDLGVLHDLAAIETLEVQLADRLASGQTIGQIARQLAITPNELERRTQRLCRLYLCERDELATAIAATRGAA